MVACILGTTRSAFAIRSRHVSLSCSCWAMVRSVAMCSWNITGDELTIATYAALQVHKVIGVANGPNALADQFAHLRQALVLLASGFRLLQGLLQARCHLSGTARAASFQRIMFYKSEQ